MLDSKVEQRINHGLNFEEADRVPVCDFLDNRQAFYYFAHSRKMNLETKVRAYHGLGIDICWRFERRRDIRQNNILKNLKQRIFRKERLNVLSDNELMAEVNDYKAHKKSFEPHTYLAMSAEGCLSVIYKNLGFENFCEMMYEAPFEIEKLIEIFAENLYLRAKEFSQQFAEGVFFITDDIAYKKGLIFAPNFLKNQWLPKIKNAISPLKQHNIKVILHSDGNMEEIIDDLIDIGIDGIHPVDRQADMDIVKLKKMYDKKLLLFGNIDLYSNDSAEVTEQTKLCIKHTSSGGGHFIGSNSGIDNNIKLGTIFSFFTAINDYGKYPIKW